MCNEVARRIALGLIREDFSQLKIVLRFSEGLPNLAAADSIRITDTTAIIRAAPANNAETAEADMIQRRWSWPSPNGKPVYNYRSEGRELGNSAKGGRCLIPIDGFYEFTAPADPKAKRKDKWLFTCGDAPFFCVAGLWRADPRVGEAFTMLTCEPGPDIAPYHSRQIVLMPREHWADWLGGEVPSAALIAPTPAGTLHVARA
ncbi:SOS response-associated peptidase family protein [Sandarakinorhabdus sp. DWP1-3-1]|uniref:SOS response-associated peptidase family protein n=1 Tax=Sandarakinorhabdus sp. DWP1-3-1 TaxID=2804627 RepID=UPI003CECE522